MSAGLRFSGVGRRFAEAVALRSLDLDCPVGELTCLAGPNGAGKSTALALAAGLLAPSRGEIRFGDRSVRPEEPPASTGYLPQRSSFHPALRVTEVLDFTVAGRRMAGRELRRALDLTGLDTVRRRFVGELSGGWMRRLGLFAALAGDPELLLLDEPFVGLDPETHDRLVAHLTDRVAAGVTLVVASHDFEVVDPFGPRVAVLDEGRLLEHAPAGGGDATEPTVSSRTIYRRALAAATTAATGEERP